MKHPDDGILLVDKKADETSHDVVRKVKSAFGHPRSFKVGHAGTLDPFATGLLMILLGQGTKLSRFMMAGEKEYLATLTLGIETDTLDPTGKVMVQREVPLLDPGTILETAKRYEGTIRQTPPAYSAVKYQGTRAYQLARKGIPVDLKERTVVVRSLEIVSIMLPDITMRIRCASGTYIRSLAVDFARDLGPGGCLKSLRRLNSGPFHVHDAVSSGEVSAGAQQMKERLISLRDALPGMREVKVPRAMAENVRQGYQPFWNELDGVLNPDKARDKDYLKLVSGERLLAIIRNNDGGRGYEKVIFERVFS